MTKTRLTINPLQPFQTGQVWRLEKSHLQIREVGKLLVHYRQYKGPVPRGLSSLIGKQELEKYLKSNKATLVR